MYTREKSHGVIKVTHNATQSYYFGVSADVLRGIPEELRRLRNGFHSNVALQNLYRQDPNVTIEYVVAPTAKAARETLTDLALSNENDPLNLVQRVRSVRIGAYRIRHTVTGHYYFGSSSNLEVRKCAHITKLKGGAHQATELQNAWNSYPGEDRLEFTFFITDTLEAARKLERKLIADAVESRDVLLVNQKLTKEISINVANLLDECDMENEEASLKVSKLKWITYERDRIASSREVEIDGIVYPSITDAAKALGIKMGTLYYRLNLAIKPQTKPDGARMLRDNKEYKSVKEYQPHPLSRRIEVDGLIYPSLNAASEATGIQAPTIKWRADNGKPGYVWLEGPKR